MSRHGKKRAQFTAKPYILQTKRPRSDNDDTVLGISRMDGNHNAASGKLFDLLTKCDAYWPMFNNIAGRLSISTISSLSKTCKAASHMYQEVLKTQWNIHMRLKKFLKDPAGFRLQLRENRALVFGRFVLNPFGNYLVRTTLASSVLCPSNCRKAEVTIVCRPRTSPRFRWITTLAGIFSVLKWFETLYLLSMHTIQPSLIFITFH